MTYARPQVSVIVPVFNVEPYVRKCLDSIIAQTLQDIEIICVDDGSTDGSLEVLEEYAVKDSRIKVLKQKNLGAGEARNAGMGVSQGDYLFFFDADDFAKPAMLERMADFAKKHNADVVVSEFYRYDDSLHAVYGKHKLPADLMERAVISGEDVSERIFRIFKWSPWNKLFRRAFVEKHGLRWQSVFRCNDIAFVNEAISLAGAIGLVGEAFYYYRQHTGSNLSSRLEKSPLAEYEAWCELRRRLQEKKVFFLYEFDFKRVVYQGAMTILNSIENFEELNMFFSDLKETIIPDMGLSRDVFTEATNTSVYGDLAKDIEESDSPLPFLLRYRTLHKANVRRRFARHLLVEKKLRSKLAKLSQPETPGGRNADAGHMAVRPERKNLLWWLFKRRG